MAYNRIFLSHKGVDKERVREYSAVLKAMGLQPWLDEEVLKAGDTLDLEKGMADSCAAVFFVTPAFKAVSWIKDEIEYALKQKKARGNGFKIITLRLADKKGKRRKIPKSLASASSVWKTPKTDMEGIKNIVEALPPYILERQGWYLPLQEIVPPSAKDVALVGQNLAGPLGLKKQDYLRFKDELKKLLSKRAFPSLETITIMMMTPKALQAIHSEAANHMRAYTIKGLTWLSKDIPRDQRITIVFHPSATLTMIAVDWDQSDKAFALVTPKLQRTPLYDRARVLMDQRYFDAPTLKEMIRQAANGEEGAVSVSLRHAPKKLGELLTAANI